jgi:integrase
MNLIDLMEQIAEPDETGLLTITPYSDIDHQLVQSVPIASVTSLNHFLHGDVRFGDDIWRENAKRSVDFSGLPIQTKHEIKAAVLLASNVGLYEGGNGHKFDSVTLQAAPAIKLGSYLKDKDIASLAEFNTLPELIIRNHIVNFICDVLRLGEGDQIYTHQFRFFQEHLNYGLLTPRTCEIFWDEIARHGIDLNRKHVVLSHPIIPSSILKQVIAQCERRLHEASAAFEAWDSINTHYIEALAQARVCKPVSNTSSLVRVGLGEKFNSRLKEGYLAFDNLKLYVLVYILAYTGMRKEEALSCKIGCAKRKDGRFYIEATLTKTDESEVVMLWVANQDTYDAVKLLERYVLAMHKRAEIILEKHSDVLPTELKHRLTEGLKRKLLFGVADNLTSINFTEARLGSESNDPSKASKFSLHHLRFTLTTQDIDQLESLGCNYKSTRGNKRGDKYSAGSEFNITSHMFRHTFAWFIIANRLGDLDDIKHQYKHLASSMTLVYTARGYETADELIGLFEDFQELLVDNIVQEIAQEASEGVLKGAGGEILNKGAKELVFSVKATEASSTGRTIKQIHFKDLNAYANFLVQNIRDIRGLPHGYCTGGSDCKLKNVGIPSGCVYCPNYVVTERQRVHWRAMKGFVDRKLAVYYELPASKQADFELLAQSWKNTSKAASIILTDSNPLIVETTS